MRKPADTAATDLRWYLGDKDSEDTCRSLFTQVNKLRDRSRARREMYRHFAELYGAIDMSGLGLYDYSTANLAFVPPELPFNVIRRGVNTVVAKVGKHRPLPMVLTSRGDYSQYKRARGLTRFIEGAFNRMRVFELTSGYSAREAGIFGTAIVHVYHLPGDDLPQIDRVLPHDLLVDSADGRDGQPLCLYRVRWIDRTVLKERFPDFVEEIDASADDSDDRSPDYDETQDLVRVVEAYRLSTGKKSPGRYMLAVSNTVLNDQPWDRDTFPFCVLRYTNPIGGFFGEGLAYEMRGFQADINYTCETLRVAHRSVGAGMWLVPDGGDIVDTQLTDDAGVIVKYRQGFAPEYINPTPAPPQVYQWLEQLTSGSLQWSGISTMSANAEKPAGVTAAKAISTLDDIEADNFAVFEQAWEQFHVDIANCVIDEMKEIAKKNPSASILAPMRRSLLEIVWKDVDLERDAIDMQVWPTKLLGRTPAARLQQVNDLYNAGIIDRNLYLKLLDAPDVDAETDLDAAARTICDEQIERMLDADDPEDEDAFQRPGPYQDLVYAMHRAQQHINLGMLMNVPDGNLDLLMQYIDEAKGLLDKRNQPAPGQSDPNQQPMATIGAAPPDVAPPAPTPGQPPPGMAA